MRSRALTAVLSAVLLLPLAGTAVATPTSPRIAWHACGDVGGECATIAVPIDWANPSGPKFDLAIGRRRATDPAHRIGVLFSAPGGPGGSGIDEYTLKNEIPADSVLYQRFDIVTWDPRGVKRSHEVQCDSALLEQAPTTFPDNEEQYRKLLAHNAKLGADCRAHTGPLFDHVDTVSAVRDLEAIRAALGEQTLSFYGVSYGTQVGQQYAELFGDRVRAMAIDSNMDHSMVSGAKYIETASADLEGSFTAFADWCARTANCPLHGTDVRKVWDGLLAKAEAGTLTDPKDGEEISSEALQSELMNAMYEPRKQWYGEADRLKSLNAGTPDKTTAAAKAKLTGNSYQAIWCEDWNWRVSGFSELKAYRDNAAKHAPRTKLSALWSDVTTCLGWPAKVVNPQHRLDVHGDPSILIVKGKYDVATPRAWNYAVAEQLDGAALLEYDGIGHGQFFNSSCVRAKVEEYLVTEQAPARGTRCAAVWPTTPPSAPAPITPIHSA
ncbi:alpha/beta hydrolase [Kutzneria viridogrisea]|uniref:Pimeloyl-ACP methyl ester carboxylesterase n=1 Tax=Kutzneria viridogrisea TaxID=47990 RepID=A0ABR6B908_9PSEU|nr:pimeloyl-ACP methyl ester carboxylesterase [Kutzneria viridogrisea]